MPSTTRPTTASSPPALGSKCGPAAGASCAATFAAAKTATAMMSPKRVAVRCIISSPDNCLLTKTTKMLTRSPRATSLEPASKKTFGPKNSLRCLKPMGLAAVEMPLRTAHSSAKASYKVSLPPHSRRWRMKPRIDLRPET